MVVAGCRDTSLRCGRRWPVSDSGQGEHRCPRSREGTHPDRCSCVRNTETPSGSGRGCHGAIQAIFEVVKGRRPKRLWVLDADLAGAFDRISHDHILTMLGTFPAKGMIAQWLKAGVVENGRLYRTEEGTPQGGIVSPVLLNVALHGMEEAAGVSYLSSGSIRVDSPAVIRYADLCGCPHKSAYAESVVMPSWCWDRPWLLGLGAKSSA